MIKKILEDLLSAFLLAAAVIAVRQGLIGQDDIYVLIFPVAIMVLGAAVLLVGAYTIDWLQMVGGLVAGISPMVISVAWAFRLMHSSDALFVLGALSAAVALLPFLHRRAPIKKNKRGVSRESEETLK